MVFTIGFTYFMATLEDGSELDGSGNSKSRGAAAILRIAHHLVGPTGIMIIGTLISLIIAYSTYSRFKNPEQNIVFK